MPRIEQLSQLCESAVVSESRILIEEQTPTDAANDPLVGSIRLEARSGPQDFPKEIDGDVEDADDVREHEYESMQIIENTVGGRP